MGEEKPWTEACERESLAMIFEHAARCVRQASDVNEEDQVSARAVARKAAHGAVRDEATFCAGAVLEVARHGIHSEARLRAIWSNFPNVDQLVREMRAAAEGRVKFDPPEEFFRVKLADGSYLADGETEAPTEDPREAWAPRRGETADQVAMGIPGAHVVTVTLKRRRILRAPKDG